MNSPRKRLDSWKEIADYLGRDVRTVIRWEQEKGLPVHRQPQGKRQPVFAFADEIDAWLKGQSAPLEAPEPSEPGQNTNLRYVILGAAVIVVVALSLWRSARRDETSAPTAKPPSEITFDWPGGRLDFQRSEVPLSSIRLGHALVAGDINRDGHLDLTLGDSLSATVGVLLGRGDGTFAPPHAFEHCAGIWDSELADIDGDGALDYVSMCHELNAVGIMWGSGDGAFPKASRFPVGRGPWAVAVGDINEDGRLDLVTASRQSGGLSILLNKGNRNFGSREISLAPELAFVALDDLDGDHHLDVAAVTFAEALTGQAFLLKGRGDGTFAPPFRVDVENSAYGVAMQDLDGDGLLEVAIPRLDGSVQILEGKTGKVKRIVKLPREGIGFAALADFNADGKADLLSTNTWQSSLSFLPGIGDGTFVQSSPATQRIGGYPTRMVLADFNEDGLLDVAVSVPHDSAVAILLQRKRPQ